LRPRPRPTPFPYTTLFRSSPLAVQLHAAASSSALTPDQAQQLHDRANALQAKAQQAASVIGRLGRAVEPAFRPLGYDWQLTETRSEEHTSELQSRENLVCR